MTEATPALKLRKGREAPATIVKPVENAVRILRYLGETGKPSTVTAIARELSINPSTCYNILQTLSWTGMIEFDITTKSYATGLGVVDLAGRALHRGAGVNSIIQPMMDGLAERHGVGVALWRRLGAHSLLLLAENRVPSPVRRQGRAGDRIPLLSGSMGLLMAAFANLTDEEADAEMREAKWFRAPPLNVFLEEVASTRARGWAVDHGRFEPGVTTVSAPAFAPDGSIQCALSVSLLGVDVEARALETAVGAIVQLAQAYTDLLNG